MAKEVTRGRKPIEINWDQFDKLCAMQCTLMEIASWFNCTTDTIQNHVKREHGMIFSAYYEQKAAKGKISLRRVQWKNAIGGNTSMQIWLGKQYLGQSDSPAPGGNENKDEEFIAEMGSVLDGPEDT